VKNNRVFLTFLGFFLGISGAAAVDFVWMLPTEYEDDTPILAGELDFATLTCVGESPFVYQDPSEMSSEVLPVGDHTCIMTATTDLGITSAPSEPYSFTVAPPPPVPNAPTIISATD